MDTKGSNLADIMFPQPEPQHDIWVTHQRGTDVRVWNSEIDALRYVADQSGAGIPIDSNKAVWGERVE